MHTQFQYSKGKNKKSAKCANRDLSAHLVESHLNNNCILHISGHCMMEDDKLCSPKTFSAATSPIKETIRHGSRELVKKLISRDVQTEKYAGGFNSSSSSEKVKTISNRINVFFYIFL